MPCYLVTDGKKEKLIEAGSQSAARNHFIGTELTTKLAEPADYQRVIKAGGEIEVAGQTPPPHDPEPDPPADPAPDADKGSKTK